MIGKIMFSIEKENVEIIVEEGIIKSHSFQEVENKKYLYTDLTFFNEDYTLMTNKQYDAFYEENEEIIELIADLESKLQRWENVNKTIKKNNVFK